MNLWWAWLAIGVLLIVIAVIIRSELRIARCSGCGHKAAQHGRDGCLVWTTYSTGGDPQVRPCPCERPFASQLFAGGKK